MSDSMQTVVLATVSPTPIDTEHTVDTLRNASLMLRDGCEEENIRLEVRSASKRAPPTGDKGALLAAEQAMAQMRPTGPARTEGSAPRHAAHTTPRGPSGAQMGGGGTPRQDAGIASRGNSHPMRTSPVASEQQMAEASVQPETWSPTEVCPGLCIERRVERGGASLSP